MSDSEIIWAFLCREYDDKHQAVYLYACGEVRTKNLVINQITPIIEDIFHPPVTKPIILTTVKGYLEFKTSQYKNNLITLRPIYQ